MILSGKERLELNEAFTISSTESYTISQETLSTRLDSDDTMLVPERSVPREMQHVQRGVHYEPVLLLGRQRQPV